MRVWEKQGSSSRWSASHGGKREEGLPREAFNQAESKGRAALRTPRRRGGTFQGAPTSGTGAWRSGGLGHVEGRVDFSRKQSHYYLSPEEINLGGFLYFHSPLQPSRWFKRWSYSMPWEV